MKETINNPENAVEYSIPKQWKRIASVVKKNTKNGNSKVRKTKQNMFPAACHTH